MKPHNIIAKKSKLTGKQKIKTNLWNINKTTIKLIRANKNFFNTV